MKASHSDPSRISPAALRALVIALVASGIPALRAEDAKAAAPADKAASSLEAAPGEFVNSVTLGGGTSFVGGDRAQFQRQLQRPTGVFGGIEDLHYEQSVGKKGLLTIDGKGIFGNHDYGFQVGLTNPEIGYVKAGYTEFRTYYDGSGGYSSNSNAWVRTPYDQLALDRRHAFFAAGLNLPDWPVLSVRYDYDQRIGQKDSSEWADYNITQNPKVAVTKYLIPTWLGIDETRQSFDADVKHTIGNTTAGIGLRYETDKIDDTRNIVRRVGEPTLQRYITSSDNTTSDFWNFHSFTETKLHPKVQLSTGFSFTRMDTDLAGSRIFGADYGQQFATTYVGKQNGDEGFYDLNGGSRVDQFVGNVNLLLTPWKNVTIVPSFKLEHQNQDGDSLFTQTRGVLNATNNTTTLTRYLGNEANRFTDVSEGLALRYTGLTNWAFYARGDWLQGQGTLRQDQYALVGLVGETLGNPVAVRDSDITRRTQKYTVGANWYPIAKLNAAVQYYYKIRETDYNSLEDDTFYPKSPSDLYPAYIKKQELDTHDINFRLTFRPLANVTLVSRYDYQETKYHILGDVNNTGIVLGDAESAKMHNHIFSQSVGWTPLQQLYFQGNISYAIQRTDSPVANTTGTGANLVQNARNDYWNASLSTGFVLSERSDLIASYVYYRANNFQDNSLVSLPYGSGATTHGVTTTLVTRLRKDLIWKLQYGYYTGHDETSGGNNDYTAHLVYSSLQYLF